MTGRETASNSPEKDFAEDFIDRNAQAIRTLNDSIFYFGELGMQEFETAALMSGLLEQEGFKVERGIAGFPTGFCATYGSGEPGHRHPHRVRRQPRQFAARRRRRAELHRRGRAGPLRGPQRQWRR